MKNCFLMRAYWAGCCFLKFLRFLGWLGAKIGHVPMNKDIEAFRVKFGVNEKMGVFNK